MSNWKEFLKNPKKLFFILASLFNVELILGPYAPVRIDDRFDIGLVAMKSAGQNLFKYGIHYWDGSAISGAVTAASAGFSIFHPAVILSGFLPLWLVYLLWKIAATFGAGYGMYLYSSRILKLSDFASFCAGLLMLAVTRQYEIVASFAYLFPLYLYCFTNCVNGSSLYGRSRYLLVIAVIFMFSLPHATIPFFPVIQLVMIKFLVRPFNLLKKYFAWFIFIWGIYAVLQSPTLYLLVSEAASSHRVEFQRYWLWTYYAGQWVVDNVVKPALGSNLTTLIPTALLLISLLSLKSRIVRFWWAYIAIVCAVLSITESAYGAGLYKYLGFLKAARFSMALPFAFSLLAAYAVFYLEQTHKKERAVNKLFPAVLTFLIVLSVYLFFRSPSLITWIIAIVFLFIPVILIIIFLIVFKNRKIRLNNYLIYLILLFVLAGFRAETALRYTLTPYNFYFGSSTASRIGSELQRGGGANLYRAASLSCTPFTLQYHGLQTIDGNMGIYPLRYKHYWEKVIEPWLKKTDRDSADYFLFYGPKVYLYYTPDAYERSQDFVTFSPEANFNLLALGNVKYVFSPAPIPEAQRYNLSPYLSLEEDNNREFTKVLKLKRKAANLKKQHSFAALKDLVSYILEEKAAFGLPQVVYTLNTALPRAFIAGDWSLYKTESLALEYLGQTLIEKLAKKAVLIESDVAVRALPNPHKELNCFTRINKYTPDYINITTASDQKAILILTDNFHRNWKAFVNNRPAEIFPVYVTYRAIVIPKGESCVEFKYQDRALTVLYWISLFALIAVILFWLISRRLYE